MRHRVAGVKLSRTAAHRRALFRNLVTALLEHEAIRTTDAKAKEIRRWDPDAKALIVVEDVELLNGVVITGSTIWSELDRRMSERQATGRRI